MSKLIFRDMFSLDTRRNRDPFFMFFLLTIIAIVLATVMLFTSAYITALVIAKNAHPIIQFLTIVVLWGGLLLASIFMVVMTMCYYMQRCNDIGISRLWVLTFFNPIFFNIGSSNTFSVSGAGGTIIGGFYAIAGICGVVALGFFLYLFFKKGQDGENAFGLNPLDVDWKADQAKNNAS